MYLLDADGKTAALDEDGKPKTLRKHFAELSADPVHGANFKPKYGSGSGSRNSRDGSFSGLDLDSLSGAELIAEGLKAQAPRRR
jgi:hypothetical protein